MSVVRLYNDGISYIGLSSDTKPATLENGKTIPAGRRFRESDTKKTFVFDGVSAWIDITDATNSGDPLPVSFDSIEFESPTPDDFNCNANMQVGEADVSNSNPVPTQDKRSSTAPAATPVTVYTTAGGTVIIAANANRISVTLQNTGSEPCIIRYGGDPSTSAYNMVLAEDSGTRLGTGGSVTIRDYTGAIKGITEANSTIIAVTEVV